MTQKLRVETTVYPNHTEVWLKVKNNKETEWKNVIELTPHLASVYGRWHHGNNGQATLTFTELVEVVALDKTDG